MVSISQGAGPLTPFFVSYDCPPLAPGEACEAMIRTPAPGEGGHVALLTPGRAQITLSTAAQITLAAASAGSPDPASHSPAIEIPVSYSESDPTHYVLLLGAMPAAVMRYDLFLRLKYEGNGVEEVVTDVGRMLTLAAVRTHRTSVDADIDAAGSGDVKASLLVKGRRVDSTGCAMLAAGKCHVRLPWTRRGRTHSSAHLVVTLTNAIGQETVTRTVR